MIGVRVWMMVMTVAVIVTVAMRMTVTMFVVVIMAVVMVVILCQTTGASAEGTAQLAILHR